MIADWNATASKRIAHGAWIGVGTLIEATIALNDNESDDPLIRQRMASASKSVTGNRPPEAEITYADLRLMMIANLRQLIEELERIKAS